MATFPAYAQYTNPPGKKPLGNPKQFNKGEILIERHRVYMAHSKFGIDFSSILNFKAPTLWKETSDKAFTWKCRDCKYEDVIIRFGHMSDGPEVLCAAYAEWQSTQGSNKSAEAHCDDDVMDIDDDANNGARDFLANESIRAGSLDLGPPQAQSTMIAVANGKLNETDTSKFINNALSHPVLQHFKLSPEDTLNLTAEVEALLARFAEGIKRKTPQQMLKAGAPAGFNDVLVGLDYMDGGKTKSREGAAKLAGAATEVHVNDDVLGRLEKTGLGAAPKKTTAGVRAGAMQAIVEEGPDKAADFSDIHNDTYVKLRRREPFNVNADIVPDYSDLGEGGGSSLHQLTNLGAGALCYKIEATGVFSVNQFGGILEKGDNLQFHIRRQPGHSKGFVVVKLITGSDSEDNQRFMRGDYEGPMITWPIKMAA